MRTPEQETADNELAAAISKAAQAAFPGNAMVVDYIVLVQREDVDTPEVTSYNYLLSGGTMPWHRILGLMAVSLNLMQANLRDGD